MKLNNSHIQKTVMKKIESYLYFVFGREKATTIYYTFSFKLEELYKVSEFDSPYKANLAFIYILPIIALCRALVNNNMIKEEAINFIRNYIFEYQKEEVEKYLKLINTPFYYSFFDRKIKKYQEKHFPMNEFNTKWVEFNNQRIYFDINRCIYMEILEEYGEEGLKQLFCEIEKNIFSKIEDKVEFTVPKKISLGDDCCQFRFFKKDAR